MAEQKPTPPPPPGRAEPQRSSPGLSKPSGPGYSLLPGRIPAPLQQLFERFPLYTYPANELPARCPRRADGGLPKLFVFISPEDAAKGKPSFNPTCLKWQTFLRIAGVKVQILPSTNHASPSGALPYLLAPGSAAPLPAHRLQAYAQAHGPDAQAVAQAGDADEAALAALVDHPLRRAWLHALYLAPANAPLLEALYLAPASRSGLVRRSLRAQLRAAAAADLAAAHNGVDPPPADALRADAAAALAALDGRLRPGRPWLAGPAPGLLDAAVFAYTHLLLSLDWPDPALPDLLRRFPALLGHRDRLLERLWDSPDHDHDHGHDRDHDAAAGDWEKV